MKKRLLSALLILALLLAVLPQTALLAGEPACAHEHLAPFSQSFENTRGEFCYMLWRMAGAPEPTIENDYADISETDEYYQAVLWAAENGIVIGTTASSFSPDMSLTRGQAVTFLWRYAGRPTPENTNTPFLDLRQGAFYVESVEWAYENDWLDLNTDGMYFRPEYAVGTFVLEGTVCEDCGAVVETEKLTLSEAVIAKGTFGDDLEWKLADGTLSITGSGEMPDLEEGEPAPWYQYKDYILGLSLPEGLENIGDRVFFDCFGLHSVTIPDSVEYIGVSAFGSCRYLENVTLPEGLQYIDEGAFAGCAELRSVTIPGSVIHIGDHAFASCGLGEVKISEGVESIGDEAFINNIGLKKVSIPKSVVHVGYDVFGTLGSNTVGGSWENGVLYLDGWALTAKRDITAAQIKSGTRGIADGAFRGYDYLTSAALPDGLQYIGIEAFSDTDLTSVKLPQSLLCLYGGAFAGCLYLLDVKIPDGVEYIGDGAFYNCASLRSVTLPKGLQVLDRWTFAYCFSLKRVEIPASVTIIGDFAFYECDSLTGLTIPGRQCEIIEDDYEPEYMLGDPETTTIYGYEGTPVAAYAEKYGYRFVALSEKVPFVDVPANAFYADPVAWAVDNEITNGVDDTHFGPDRACTRGQVVTFLWRAAGCPAPKSTKTGFLDVKAGAFYETAVAWAVEQGITNGMTDISFAPDATCTRGQIVTFLWRFKGSPAPENTATPFTDLNPKGYYVKAVAWAVENEVTNGMTATTFAPDATCTRGQVVTFLRRAAGE